MSFDGTQTRAHWLGSTSSFATSPRPPRRMEDEDEEGARSHRRLPPSPKQVFLLVLFVANRARWIIFPRQGLMSSALLARLHQAPPRLPELPDRSRSDKNLRLRDSPSPSKHGLSAKKFYPEQEFTFEELVSYLSIRVATRASSSSYYISRPGTSYHWTLVKRNQATY
jgi:hypothetical protein